ncbi:MAG: hypothetical protein M3R03_02190 [Pseudomonadota bacterium]|nr:hypothetical protein [Pseudomonadota bacterium]
MHKLLSTSEIITKVARGTYQLTRFLEDSPGNLSIDQSQNTVEDSQHPGRRLREEDFYASFAEWLLENEEANEATALGGSLLRGKWGTPDIIGVMRARANDILKFPTQIVTAEVKIDPFQTVTALGQALAYRLFSHRTFVVLPNSVSEDDRARLKALCSLHGIGLVLFELNVDAPNFTLMIPPALAEPDMFYTNQMARRLSEIAPDHFNRFFS